MKEIILDRRSSKNRDDVYDSFFRAVGSPQWHGRNFDAFNDSIATGSINEIEVPYRLAIKNYELIGNEAKKKMTDDFVDLIREIAADGCPVEIQVHESKLEDP